MIILESRECIVPVPKANVHQQSAIKFGKDCIEKLRNEKYPIDDYKIPTYREVMDKCIPKKSHVHVSWAVQIQLLLKTETTEYHSDIYYVLILNCLVL